MEQSFGMQRWNNGEGLKEVAFMLKGLIVMVEMGKTSPEDYLGTLKKACADLMRFVEEIDGEFDLNNYMNSLYDEMEIPDDPNVIRFDQLRK